MTLKWKTNRKLLLGVSGGISAYKVPEIIREFKKSNWDLEVVLSDAAENFVSPMAISALTGKKVWLEEDFLSREEGWKIPHITLAEWAELIVVAPVTASFLHKAANGDASTLLSAVLLSNRSPVLFFPAMNVNMWEHRAVQENAARCVSLGYHMVEPEEGELACGYEGKGRLPSIGIIREESFRAVSTMKDMEGLKVLVTSGPTREAIDPVRFISNPSSGKMGSAIARTAWYRGADVTMVSGPSTEPVPYGVRNIPITTAVEMFEAVMDQASRNDIIVKAAAVGDFAPLRVMDRKIKRIKDEKMILELSPNPDIAAAIGANKRPGQYLVGFAAETEDTVANASAKLARKGLDLIVANDVGGENPVFGSDNNSVLIIDKNGLKKSSSGSKEEVADSVWTIVLQNRGSIGL